MTKKFKAAEDFTPNPINLLESNRSLGYSIEEAVSDLIDNSIAADAKNISFNLKWNSGKPYFTLVDDGKGMTKNELVKVLSLDQEIQMARDIQRSWSFWMWNGSSLSQSKAFVVVTKSKNSELEKRCLDLDYIATEWIVEIKHAEIMRFLRQIKKLKNGTALIWNSWDKCPRSERF